MNGVLNKKLEENFGRRNPPKRERCWEERETDTSSQSSEETISLICHEVLDANEGCLEAAVKKLDEQARNFSKGLPFDLDFQILDLLLNMLDRAGMAQAALSCLATITAHEDEISLYLVEHQFVSRACHLAGDPNLVRSVLCSLANIAAVSPGDVISPHVYQIVDAAANDHLRSGARLIMLLAPADPTAEMLERLLRLIHSSDPEVTIMACFGLHYLIEAAPAFAQTPQVSDIALQCLQSDSPQLKLAGCHFLLDFVRNGRVLLDLPGILALTETPNREIQRLVTLVLNEILRSRQSRDDIQAIASYANSGSFTLKEECTKLFADLLINTPWAVTTTIETPILDFFDNTLSIESPVTLRLVIRAILRLLRDTPGDDLHPLLARIQNSSIMDLVTSNPFPELEWDVQELSEILEKSIAGTSKF